jgi:hypothetical protein
MAGHPPPDSLENQRDLRPPKTVGEQEALDATEEAAWYQGTVPKGRLILAQHAVLGLLNLKRLVP